MTFPPLALISPETLEKAIGQPDLTVAEHIGHGGQGSIFKGSCGTPPVDVAIKLYDPRGIDARIDREVSSLSHIASPSLARAIREGRVVIGKHTIRFVAWEFVDGVCARHLVDPEAPLSTKEVARCGFEIASLLTLLWRDRIIHRDIKPDNIIRRPDGTFVLVDFGLARFTSQQSLSYPGAQIGTSVYMPLEQFRGDKGLTVYADVFALGVTLLELATGSHPTDWDVARLHLGAVAMDGLGVLPDGLRELISQMLEPVPERRPLPEQIAREITKYV